MMTEDERQDFLNALTAEVESQGGTRMAELCEPIALEFPAPQGKKPTRDLTCHCGHESVFVTAYEPTTAAKAADAYARGGGLVRACAFCDGMSHWPRYQGVHDAL